MTITKEKIDKIFLTAAENNLLDLKNQFVNALDEIPNESENCYMREVLAASIAQGNVMAALKEICYVLLLESD